MKGLTDEALNRVTGENEDKEHEERRRKCMEGRNKNSDNTQDRAGVETREPGSHS